MVLNQSSLNSNALNSDELVEIIATGEIILPALLIEAEAPTKGVILLTLPEPIIAASGNDNDNARAAITLPSVEITIETGWKASIQLVAPLLTVSGSIEPTATAELELPSPILAVSGVFGELATSAVILPKPFVTGSTGAFASLSLIAPQLTASASLIDLANSEVEFPILEIAATGIVGWIATITLELPEAITLTASGSVGGVAIAVLGLPALQLAASTVGTDIETSYAVNLTSGAVTQLLMGEFDKLVTAHGRLYGLRGGVLVKLEGDLDDGGLISATVRFAPQQFGTNHVKRVSDIYLNSREDDGMTLTLVPDEVATWDYQTPTDRAPAMGTHKVKVGRGVTFHSLGMILRNRNGGRLDLGGVELLVQPLSRRPR